MNIDKIKEKISSIDITSLVLWLLVIVGVIFRLKVYFYNQSFCRDECALGASINMIGTNYINYFKPLILFQCAPPFFMIVCSFLLNISNQAGHLYNQDIMLRLFPCLCSIASLPLFAILLKKISNDRYFIWISMAILSFNRVVINYAQEFKQYSCEMMFTLILLMIFYNFEIKQISIKKLVLYTIIFNISIWFSGSAILILFVGYLLLLYEIFKNKYFNKFKLSILFIPTFLNIIAYYFIYFRPVTKKVHEHMYEYWSLSMPSFFKISTFFPMFTHRMQELICFQDKNLIILLLLIGIYIFLTRTKFNYKIKFLVITPVILLIMASFMQIYPFYCRLILFLLPLFSILFTSLSFLLRKNKITTILLIAIFIILTNNKLTISSSNMVIHKCYFREYSKIIIKNNISSEKMIIAHKNGTIYYLQHSNILKPNSKILYDKYNFSKVPKFIKTIPNGDYWIICLFTNRLSKNNYKIIKYIQKDSHLKIIKKWQDKKDKNIFIVHFEKISDY